MLIFLTNAKVNDVCYCVAVIKFQICQGGFVYHIVGVHVSLKKPHFDPFFLKIPGFFSVSDKSILTSEMNVINYPEHNHVFTFF